MGGTSILDMLYLGFTQFGINTSYNRNIFCLSVYNIYCIYYLVTTNPWLLY